jgi:hypothetical protein
MAKKYAMALLLSASLLTGCVAVSIQETEVDPYYTPDLVRGIIADGEFPSQVRGSPFTGQADIAEKARARLRMPGWFSQARFVPAQSVRQHRVVLVFGPTLLGLRGKEACGDFAGMKLAPGNGEIELVVAFCIGDRVLNQIRIQGARVKGPDDPAFGRLLDQSIVSLLPSNDTDRTGDCVAGAPC